MAEAGTIETVSGAECPVCHYRNDMPYECLRDNWQDLDCDRCGTLLEYRGVRVSASWEVEIHTRLKAKAA